jgi:hypothetical protein
VSLEDFFEIIQIKSITSSRVLLGEKFYVTFEKLAFESQTVCVGKGGLSSQTPQVLTSKG